MAYDTPTGFTDNFNIALFGENSNPGAAQLNTNWTIIDTALADVGIGPEDDLEVNNLIVNGSLKAFEFIVEQVKATQGGVIVSAASGVYESFSVLTPLAPYVLRATDGDAHTSFQVDDIVLIQRKSLDGSTIVKQLFRKVTNVDGNRIMLDTCSGTPPADVGTIGIGDVFVQIGNETDSDRQGSIYITATDEKPKIQIRDQISLAEYWDDSSYIQTTFGNLEDITFQGNPVTGYGIHGSKILIENQSDIVASEITNDETFGDYNDTQEMMQLVEDMADDGKLTPVERGTAVLMWAVASNEKAQLNSMADRYSVDDTNYDNAYTTLYNYMVSVGVWSAPQGDTITINATTWENNWDAYWYQRSVLINSINEAIDTAYREDTVKTFIQGTDPTLTETVEEGDLWIDTSDQNKMYRYDAGGDIWVDAFLHLSNGTTVITDGVITTSFIEALNITAQSVVAGWVYAGEINTSQLNADTISVGVQNLIDASNINNDENWTPNKVYRQDSPPTGSLNEGDIWIETDDDNEPHVYWSGSWVSTRDGTIANAQSDATSALTLAGLKNKVFYQASAPTNPGDDIDEGDVWFETDNNYHMRVWDGDSWEHATPDYADVINAGSTTIDGGKITTNTITANQIASNTITASEIQAGSITVDRLSAGTLTGFTIQTSSSGQRVIMDDSTNSVQFYDENGNYWSIIGYWNPPTSNSQLRFNYGATEQGIELVYDASEGSCVTTLKADAEYFRLKEDYTEVSNQFRFHDSFRFGASGQQISSVTTSSVSAFSLHTEIPTALAVHNSIPDVSSFYESGDSPTFAALTLTGNFENSDNDHLYIGSDDDLDIYAAGTSAYIKTKYQSTLYFTHAQDEYAIRLNGTNVALYYGQGELKLQTASSGVDITGTCEADSLYLGSGATPTTIQTTITDSDTALATSGAIVDYAQPRGVANRGLDNSSQSVSGLSMLGLVYDTTGTLSTLTGGKNGQEVTVYCSNAYLSISVTEAGNIKLAGTCTLDNDYDNVTLKYNGTYWIETSRQLSH